MRGHRACVRAVAGEGGRRGECSGAGTPEELDEAVFEVFACGDDGVEVVGPNDHDSLVALVRTESPQYYAECMR